MVDVKITEELDDIKAITGLDSADLWLNGFVLDDWSVCVISDTRLVTDEGIDEDGEIYYEPLSDAYWLIRQMEGYCCGYKEVEYDGRWYYMVYH